MRKDILITTTNVVENAIIKEYMGIISTNVVIGTNFFSDFAASFTDFFGGFSNTYQNKLQMIYQEAIDELSKKALNIGANCIIGLNIDFDEVSGKGKSMFMISAIGTAVQIEISENNATKTKAIGQISADTLNKEYLKKLLINNISEGAFPTEKEWDLLTVYDVPEISKILFNLFLTTEKKQLINAITSKENLLINKFPQYYTRLNRIIQIDIAYSNLNGINDKIVIDLILSNKLFDAKRIIDIIKDDKINIAIQLLESDKNYYTDNDIALMKNLLETISNIPDKGKIGIVKGLFSKGEEKYICPEGHKNDVSTKFCSECGLNIKGLTQKDVNSINRFSVKIEALQELLGGVK